MLGRRIEGRVHRYPDAVEGTTTSPKMIFTEQRTSREKLVGHINFGTLTADRAWGQTLSPVGRMCSTPKKVPTTGLNSTQPRRHARDERTKTASHRWHFVMQGPRVQHLGGVRREHSCSRYPHFATFTSRVYERRVIA